ncbi:hypothetical protein GLOIN_2v1765309 [Rhizophagus irregularis DAOM 181602=DAOM 197198]|nr:hypothetical protein GLOIN_2v1765309 [Rhizophagus irregularis DAOM 181602=DAOM 197198]
MYRTNVTQNSIKGNLCVDHYPARIIVLMLANNFGQISAFRFGLSLNYLISASNFIPNNNMEDSECLDNSDYEEDNIGHELQSLIDELGFVDPLAVNDYINIDNRASAEEELSLQEIVDVVKGTNEREIEEEEEQDEISTIVALNSIENVIKYIQQKDLEIGNLEMKNLIKLKKRIFFDNINEKRQSKLNEYFDFNV